MAYITASEVQTFNNVTAPVCNITPSVQNDLIMLTILCYQAASISSIVGNNGGTWTPEYDGSAANNDVYVYSCKQGATPDTSVTVTFSAAEYGHFVVRTIKKYDATTIVDVVTHSNNTASYDITIPGVTTTNNDGLVLRDACVRSYPMYPIPGLMSEGCNETASSLLFCYATWDIQETAGSVASQAWQHAAANTSTYQSTGVTIVINDDGDGVIDGYVDRSVTPYQYLAFNSQYNGRLGQAFYDPTSVSNENISSLDNGSYTNSNIYYVSNPTNDVGALENGVRSLKSFVIATYADYSLLTGVEITETAGTTDNYDLSGSLICISNKASDPRTQTDNAIGACLAISDKTNARFWQLPTSNSVPSLNGTYPTVIDVDDTSFVMDSFGTPDTTDIGAFILGSQPTAYYVNTYFGPIFKLGTIAIHGGSSARPASFDTFLKAASKNVLNTVLAQGGLADGQFFVCQNLQIGATNAIVFDSSNQSVEFPSAYSADLKKRNFKIGAAKLTLTVDLASGSTCTLSSTTINFGNYHNFVVDTTVAFTSVGLNILNSTATITNYPSNMAGISFIGCKEITHNSNSFSGGCTFNGCVDAQAITLTGSTQAALQTLLDNIANCDFLNNTTAIRIEYTGTGDIELDFTNITWTSNTTDIHYNSTNSSALTAVMAGTSNATTSAISGSATGVTIQAAVNTLSFNSDTASTLIRYFTDDSQTVVDSTTGTTLDYEYSTTDPVDVEFLKQGYVPVNRQNVTPYDGDYDVIMDFDEAYNSSHGLTITGEFDYNRATKVLTINSDQNALDVRSALADVIRTNSSYYNTPLLMDAIPGLTRIDLTNGMTITSMATWKGAGMERFDAADSTNPVEKWFAIKSVGAITGATTHYRQTSSGTSTAVTLTNNVVDEAFQYWSDPNHDGSTADGYDKSDYMVIKAFIAGKKQARVDVIANAGVSNISSNLYTVPLANVDHDYSGTDPGISGDLTLVTGGTYGGKTFAYKIVDGGTNTGADIADQINYNGANNPAATIPGGTGLTWFDLGDMVIYNATAQETERSLLEGATPAYKGFYVERAGADHPDFTRFQADDGTYYTPASVAQISAPNVTSGRVQVYNVTATSLSSWQASTPYSVGDRVLATTGVGTDLGDGTFFVCTVDGTSGGSEPTWDVAADGNTTADNAVTWQVRPVEFDNASTAGAYSNSWTDGEHFKAGDTIRFRWIDADELEIESTNTATTDGTTTFLNTPEDDTVYDSYAIDGSTVTEYSADYPNIEVDVNDPDNVFYLDRFYAWWKYNLATEGGIRNFFGGVTAVNTSNLKIHNAVIDLFFDNTKSVSARQGDTIVIARDDGAYPQVTITSGGGGLGFYYAGIGYSTSSGSGLDATERNKLLNLRDYDPETDAIEGALTYQEAQRIMLAESSGKVSISGSTVNFRDQADTKNRISATVDSNGQRTAVTVDGS